MYEGVLKKRSETNMNCDGLDKLIEEGRTPGPYSEVEVNG